MRISDWSSDVCSSDLRPSQAPVDCRQPFLTDIVSQPRLDFLVGARPKIERHQFGRPLADAMGDILASDDQLLAGVIDAAQHDEGVGMGGVEVIDSSEERRVGKGCVSTCRSWGWP